MPGIHVLSPHIANQIAAGEVVERPCSIVKELVENAVDAKATHITVEVENGGIDCIRITDNGCGIPDEDCETAFLRHATSKIQVSADLSAIATLGFRGEALASIAAVSMVTLKTHHEGEEMGTSLRYEGGELKEHRRIGCPNGTTIEVRNLFYNTPARLKFLKTPRGESGAIGDYMARLILSLPEIAFHYINNGKTVYRTNGDGQLRNALICVYGADTARHICPVAFDDGYLRITGYVGTPELSRPNRTGQTFVLNRRIIRSNALSAAVMRAFDTRIMIGRYPFCALHLQIALQEVDVNVHPAKLEVRFADEQRVTRSVCAACMDALARSYAPTVELPETRTQPDTETMSETPVARSTISGYSSASPRGTGLRDSIPKSTFQVRESAYYSENLPPVPRYQMPKNTTEHIEQVSLFSGGTASFSEPFTVIGVAFQTYWFVQQGDVVYCIDQHAAHERLLYDSLTEQQEAIISQALLYPEKVTLTPSDYALYEEHKATLMELGFAFKEEDGLTVCLTAVPQLKGQALGKAYLLDALHQGLVKKEDLMQAACKHAVKGGEPITKEQLIRLLADLSANDALLTCPHGRPIAIRLTRTELEKMFKRIQ